MERVILLWKYFILPEVAYYSNLLSNVCLKFKIGRHFRISYRQTKQNRTTNIFIRAVNLLKWELKFLYRKCLPLFIISPQHIHYTGVFLIQQLKPIKTQ